MFESVYQELRRMAQQAMQKESPGHTLQPTALVHEAYFRLSKAEPKQFQNRNEFLAAAAKAMRQILIDSARRRTTQKRGGAWTRQEINLEDLSTPETAEALLELDDALEALTQNDSLVGQVITLRFYGGLTHDEIAEMLGIGPRTVDSYWAYGKAWLATELQKSRN